MGHEEGPPCCACMRVEYDPVHNSNGTCSERWRCSSCGATFGRRIDRDSEMGRAFRALGLRPEIEAVLLDIERDVRESYEERLAYGDKTRAALARVLARRGGGEVADVDRMRLALENVRMLAARMKRRPCDNGAADHLLRFCAEAGVTGSILRDAGPAVAGGEVERIRLQVERVPEALERCDARILLARIAELARAREDFRTHHHTRVEAAEAKVDSLTGELRAWRAWVARLLRYTVDDGTARERVEALATKDPRAVEWGLAAGALPAWVIAAALDVFLKLEDHDQVIGVEDVLARLKAEQEPT